MWKQVTSEEFFGTIGSIVVFRPSVEGSQQCWLPCADASNHRLSWTASPKCGAILVANVVSQVALQGQNDSMMTSTGTGGTSSAVSVAVAVMRAVPAVAIAIVQK